MGFPSSPSPTPLQNVDQLPDDAAEKLPERITECIKNASEALLGQEEIDGLVLVTLLPLDKAPAFKDKAADVKALIDAVNANIKKLGADLKAANPNATINVFDSYNATETLLRNASALGISAPIDEPCLTVPAGYNALVGVHLHALLLTFLTGLPTHNNACMVLTIMQNGSEPESECDDPSEHVFYDNVLPTSATHGALATELAAWLEDNDFAATAIFPPKKVRAA